MKENYNEEHNCYWEICEDEIEADSISCGDVTAVSTLEVSRVNSRTKSFDALSTHQTFTIVGSTKSIVQFCSIIG